MEAETRYKGNAACYLESGKRVGSNVECRHFDKLKKIVKIIRIEEDFGQGFISGTLPQHCATVQCNLLMLVPERVINCVNEIIEEKVNVTIYP